MTDSYSMYTCQNNQRQSHEFDFADFVFALQHAFSLNTIMEN